MKFLRRYYNELFSLCLFFPLVILGMQSGVVGGLIVTSILVLFAALLFRNYQITVFSALLLISTLVFRCLATFSETSPIFLGFLVSAFFSLFCFSILHEKKWTWMWYGVVWLWSLLLFGTIVFDIVKIGFIFAVFYVVAYIFFPLTIDAAPDKRVSVPFFVLFFSMLLFEMFWAMRVFPLGILLGPVVIMILFYFFSHIYRGYCLDGSFRYYIRPTTFTFLSLLVILLTAINSVF